MRKTLTAIALLCLATPWSANAEPNKEDRVNAAFQDAGIPATQQHPAMMAFAVCVQRKAATHDAVVESLSSGGDLTKDQVESVVTISEQIWCPATDLK